MATPFNQELEARVGRYLGGEDSAATLWEWLMRYVLVPGAHRRNPQVREAAGPVIHALAELQGNHRCEVDVKNELRELRLRGRTVCTARGGDSWLVTTTDNAARTGSFIIWSSHDARPVAVGRPMRPPEETRFSVACA